MSNYEKVKILVVGDSGVGKTSMVHLICKKEPFLKPSWTVGCSIEVKLHEYKSMTPEESYYFIDFWDVGGSSSHRNARSVFYHGANGIILVHDLSNRKSEGNLRKWLIEIMNRDSSVTPFDSDLEFDPETLFGSNNVPIFVIGTKLDACEGYRSYNDRLNSVAEECGADEICLNCLDPQSFSPVSSQSVKLNRFLDKVIERRYHRETSQAFYDKRKYIFNKHFI